MRKANPILCHITKSAASNFRGVLFPLYFALLRSQFECCIYSGVPRTRKTWTWRGDGGGLLGNWAAAGLQHGSPAVSSVSSERGRLLKWMEKMGRKLTEHTEL